MADIRPLSKLSMAADPPALASTWRTALPTLSGRLVVLREPTALDVSAFVDLLSLRDASRFGLDEPVSEVAVRHLLDRVIRDRAAGVAFAYAITLVSTRAVAGLLHVRQLDPTFEGAEWECTIAPSSRGNGVFLEAARLVGTFTFDTVGAHRIEGRALLVNGRANGAMRKLGAVQEGVLRRAVRREGEYFDQVLWSLLREDWGDARTPTAPRVH
jgi:RimJ/RimL family protein N-acetyltransferase